MPCPKKQRFAWAKLNAYGILVSLLALMGIANLINPGGAPLAALLGEIPPGQAFWVAGIVASGVLLLFGFARNDRVAETMGLLVLDASLALQCAVAWKVLGWTEFTGTRLFLLLIVSLCLWARCSVLWSKDGLIFTIPPRDEASQDEQ